MTLSFNYLGHIGQLGNQMFQYAALRGICNHKNYNYTLPTNHMGNIFLYDCFKIFELEKKLDHWSNFPRILPSHCGFDVQFFNNCPSESDIFGYFQTEKYFKHIEDAIRNEYIFQDHITHDAKKYFNSMCFSDEVIGLHIRRTDYITHEFIRNLDLEYYEKSLDYFSDKTYVLIFSDDIEWCKNQKIFSNSRFKFSENNSKYVDLCLLSMCDYHIIANSTFSWWGSWLAKSKKTIAPKEWYTIDKLKSTNEWFPYIDLNSKDICPSDWKLL
jgi:hypothetical protein